MKAIDTVYDAPSGHWVGDGFPVRTLFNYDDHARQLSPFLMLDYAGPADFSPGSEPRGVGEHPHRGFETVTIVRQGEVSHRDSTGQGGTIGPGDVQWMTAGSGILHEEFHSSAFTETGGTLEMVQLWVNLPSEHKTADPDYQALEAQEIPTISLPDEGGSLRVIAGGYGDHAGPADTFTPMHVWEIDLHAGADWEFELPEGWPGAVAVLQGSVRVNGERERDGTGVVVFERSGRRVRVSTDEGASLIVLSGRPIDEPVVARGPFVMNTQAEIDEAMRDLRTGRFGRSDTSG